MTQLGVYGNNDPSKVSSFEQWLGGSVDTVMMFAGPNNTDWSDVLNNVRWAGSMAWGKPLIWTVVPMPQTTGSLSAAARGDYNGYYHDMAQIIAADQPTGDIIVRPFHEFNGDWYAWASGGHEQDFIQAFRQFVDTFRGVSDRFKFDWNVAQGDTGTVSNPEKAYPGDQYVDIISMDASYDTQWEGTDPNKAFAHMRDEVYGLQWLQNYADAHGKPTAFPEWGVNSDTAGPYIQQFANWINDPTHNVVYQAYWESNSDFAGMLENGQYPNAAAAYKAAFGQASTTSPTPAAAPIPTSTPTATAIGSGSDALVLKISEDAWQGDAQYTISDDGKQVGGTLTAHASHAAGQDDLITVQGNWGSGTHTVTVNFLNDAYGGTATADRNLYVDGITYNGQAVSGGSAALMAAGLHNFGWHL